MYSNVFLIRCGETSWHAQSRLIGQRDLGLSDRGREQAEQAVRALDGIDVTEIITSPLARAIQTAERFTAHFGITLSCDQRLTALDIGPWDGKERAELEETPEFRAFIRGESDAFPDGEPLEQVRDRMRRSLEQALDDNPDRANIVIVSHSAPLRVILAHYLGIPSAHYHRLKVSHGAVSLVRYQPSSNHARVMTINAGAAIVASLEQRH